MQDTVISSPLSGEQRRNIATRRAQLADQQQQIQDELDRIRQLEEGAGCDMCGALPSAAVERLGGCVDLLCPACAEGALDEDAAAKSLHAALWPAVVNWSARWSAAGISKDALAVVLMIEGSYWTPHGMAGRLSGNTYAAAREAVGQALAEGSQ